MEAVNSKKIMFDTNIFDLILENNLTEKVIQFLRKEKMQLLITHVQLDEVSAIPDNKREKREKLSKIIKKLNPRLIATTGVIVGESRVGRSSFGPKELIEKIRKYKKESNPSRDSLIYTTAFLKSNIFVSNDKVRNKILQKIVKENDIKICILNFEGFKNWLCKRRALEEE